MNQSEAQAYVAQYGSVAAAARALNRNERSFRRTLRGPSPPKYKTTESAVLHLTDLHYGKKTVSFNVNVLEERLDKMVAHILDINQILKNGYRFDKLFILFTGDIVDGDDIFANHGFHTDEAARYGLEQATKVAQLLVPRIKKLKAVAPKIVIHGVPGNHGRVSKRTHEMNNWDIAALTMLKMLFMEDKDVEVTVAEGFWDTVNIQGHGFLLYHGAGIRMVSGLPFYAIRQRVMRWKQTLKDPFKVVLMGHFHQCIEDSFADTRIMLSGTAVSDDEFAIECLGVDGERKMNFFGVHPDHPITWQYKLTLDS